jgi:hypothetical protein
MIGTIVIMSLDFKQWLHVVAFQLENPFIQCEFWISRRRRSDAQPAGKHESERSLCMIYGRTK